jgi:uncharacterized lipoprotein YbaY
MSVPHHPDCNCAQPHHHASGRRAAGILRIVAAFSIVATAGGCALNGVRDEPGVVSGTVKASPKIRLNPGDYVQVVLYGPAGEVARDEVRAPRKLPVRFTLRYDPAVIDASRVYHVRAAVLDRTLRSRAVTTEYYPVLTHGSGSRVRAVAIPPAAAIASGNAARYACPGGAPFAVDLGWTRAQVWAWGESRSLPATDRGRLRFAHAGHRLSFRGDTARLEASGHPAIECAGEPTQGWGMLDREGAALAARARDGRALEDQWSMTVREGAHIEFRTNGWRTRVLTSAPRRKVDRRNGRVTYRAHSPAHRLIVVAQPGACEDDGDTFPMRVTVLLDRRELHGCGGPSAGPAAPTELR